MSENGSAVNPTADETESSSNPLEWLELHTHFLMCDFCRRYHRQLDAIQKLAANVGDQEKTGQTRAPRLNEEAKERIKRVVNSSLKG